MIGHAVDLIEHAKNYEKLQRARDIAHMVLQEDAPRVGGLTAQTTWQSASDINACGKLRTLERLLQLWRNESVCNKVRVRVRLVAVSSYGERRVAARGRQVTWLHPC